MATQLVSGVRRGGVGQGGGVAQARRQRKRRGLTYLAVVLLVLGIASGVTTGWVMTTGELPFPAERVPWVGEWFRRPGPVTAEPPAAPSLPAVPAAEEVLPLLAQRSAGQLAQPASVPVGRANPFQPAYGIDSEPAPAVPPPPEGSGPGDEGPGATPGEGSAVPLRVGVRVTAPCWLEVHVDGKQALRSNVAGGSQLTYRATREVTLQEVGREGAVLLSVNGKDLGRASTLARGLSRPEEVEAGGHTVQISLGRRYPSGLLVDLTFKLVR